MTGIVALMKCMSCVSWPGVFSRNKQADEDRVAGVTTQVIQFAKDLLRLNVLSRRHELISDHDEWILEETRDIKSTLRDQIGWGIIEKKQKEGSKR